MQTNMQTTHRRGRGSAPRARRSAGSGTPASTTPPGGRPAAKATTYLKSQQLADGSFEVAGFPGFETPDAVLAIAENAQQQAKWNRRAGQDRGQRHQARRELGAARDRRLRRLRAQRRPGGEARRARDPAARRCTPTKFDPDGDGASQPAGDHRRRATRPTARTARSTPRCTRRSPSGSLGGVPPADRSRTSAAARRPAAAGTSPATRRAAPLTSTRRRSRSRRSVGGRVKKTDADLRQGLAFLAPAAPGERRVAVVRLRRPELDLGGDARDHRGRLRPDRRGAGGTRRVADAQRQRRTRHRSNVVAQPSSMPSGRILSPNDGFGINTFATTQSIQALRRGWLPVKPLGKQKCV